MPELPEVETTLLGIKPCLIQQKIKKIIIRQPKLRWKIPEEILQSVVGEKIKNITRRGKYLLFHVKSGFIIIHLGMSGSLRILTSKIDPRKHDHVDIEFSNNTILRFTDPRRFGALLWCENITTHLLLKNLGVEPLSRNFTATYLYQKIINKNAPIKSLIMNNKIVVGVGNIYATEALFRAKIHPKRLGKSLAKKECDQLVKSIKYILKKAIKKGGTTIKDFSSSEGKPGYFVQHLNVYGRAGKPCLVCKTTLESFRVGQRATVYCKKCQSLTSSPNTKKIIP